MNFLSSIKYILLLIILWVMLYDSNRFILVKHSFKDKRIKKKCRAVVVADLHNKRFGKDNDHLLKAIEECNPDFILIPGDIPTAKPGKKLEIAISFMRELAAKYPIYYANGNHEQRMRLYPETYGDMYETYTKSLEEMGVHLLVNEHLPLEEYGICVYGAEIDRYYYTRFGIKPMDDDYIEEILGKPQESLYNILLAHNPDYFPNYVKWSGDLALAGHVHGGVIRIPFWGRGMLSPNVRFFPKYDGGAFTEGKTTMLVSRGLGIHTIPFRLFDPGEVLVLDFEPEDCGEA